MKRILAAVALFGLVLAGALFFALVQGREGPSAAVPLDAEDAAAAPKSTGRAVPELEAHDARVPLTASETPAEREPAAVPTSSAPESKGLSGTIVAIDELGAEHPAEDGRFSLLLHRSDLGLYHEVEVEDGVWSTELPTDRDVVALSLAGVHLGNRQAVFEKSINERIDLPRDGRLELRVTWLADTWLHVRDRESGRELAPVLVAEVNGPESNLGHPGAAARGARDLGPSPVRIPPGASTFAPPTRIVHVRSPGYAWGRIELEAGRNGERFLELDPGGELDVHVSGSAGDPGARIRLRGADSQPLLELAFPTASSVVIDGVPAGRSSVRAEIGDWWPEPLVLGEVEATVVAGERTSVALRVEPVAALQLVPLSGELALPAAWKLEGFRLQFELLDTPLGGDDGRFAIPRSRMEPVGESGDLLGWRVPDVQPGRYVVELDELAFSTALDVPPAGLRDARIEIPAPCDVAVRCVDADTGADVKSERVSWTCALPEGVNAWSSKPAEWNPKTERWEFRAPIGSLQLSTEQSSYASPWRETFEAHAGRNEFVLRLERLCGLTAILRDGDAVIPWEDDDPPELVPAEGQEEYYSWTRNGRSITLHQTQPGHYRLKVPAVDGYEPVPDELVRLEKGVVKEHVIQLRRLP